MTSPRSASLVVLRMLTGFYYCYAGFSKVVVPAWSAAGYLTTAKTFPDLYAFFARPEILPTVNFLNKWGLILLGLSLLLGVGLRISTWLGSVLMALYYFPILTFPYVDHGFIVDTHVLLIAVLTVLRTHDAGNELSLRGRVERIGFMKRSKILRRLAA